MTETDISSEEHRTYTYPDGSTFTIQQPSKLFVLDTGSHRIVDLSGYTHRPERGWVGISWMPKSGEPAFVA